MLFADAAQSGYHRAERARNFLDREHIADSAEAYLAFEDVERSPPRSDRKHGFQWGSSVEAYNFPTASLIAQGNHGVYDGGAVGRVAAADKANSRGYDKSRRYAPGLDQRHHFLAAELAAVDSH